MIRGQGYACYIKDKDRVCGSKITYLKGILLPPTLSLTYLSFATCLSKLWNQLLTQILIYAQSYISFYVWNPCLVTTQCNRGYNHNIVLF